MELARFRWGSPLSALGIALLVGCGCGGSEAVRATRVIGGERRSAVVSPYAYEWYMRGTVHEAKGNWAEAAQAYGRARSGPADDPLLIAKLAMALMRSGRSEAADEVLRDGHRRFQRAEAIWLAGGKIAALRGETDVALRALRKAESLAPQSERAPMALAYLWMQQGMPQRARATLRRYLRRVKEPSPAAWRALLELALLQRDHGLAVRAAQQLQGRAPGWREQIRRAARQALDGERPHLAVRLLQALPPLPSELPLRLQALAAAGHEQRVEALLAASQAKGLTDPLTRARWYLQIGELARAEELGNVARVASDDPRAQAVVGRALLLQQRYARAAATLAEVPRGAVDFLPAREDLAKAMQAQGLPSLAAEVLADACLPRGEQPCSEPELAERLQRIRRSYSEKVP